MTAINPSADEFAAMLAEEKAAIRAGCDALDHTPEAAQARARFLAANEALLAARPTDPAALAMQLRWFTRELKESDICDLGILEHVAEQLEVMAKAQAEEEM
jgi:hypothetical protein